MAILLHNLLARAPRLNDLKGVTQLLIAEDIAGDGMSDASEEDVLAHWHRTGFNTETDAWIVVTNAGQYVGYTDVWSSDNAAIEMRVRVHPAFRGRGIGTFLLRLAEMRARQFVVRAQPTARVSLHCAVNETNVSAKALLEHEGYEPVHHLWRMMIADEDGLDGNTLPAMLKLDIVMKAQELTGLPSRQRRTGIYAARQYVVYEKELRGGDAQGCAALFDMESVRV